MNDGYQWIFFAHHVFKFVNHRRRSIEFSEALTRMYSFPISEFAFTYFHIVHCFQRFDRNIIKLIVIIVKIFRFVSIPDSGPSHTLLDVCAQVVDSL